MSTENAPGAERIYARQNAARENLTITTNSAATGAYSGIEKLRKGGGESMKSLARVTLCAGAARMAKFRATGLSAMRPWRPARLSATSWLTRSTVAKKRPRDPDRMQLQAMAMARCVLPFRFHRLGPLWLPPDKQARFCATLHLHRPCPPNGRRSLSKNSFCLIREPDALSSLKNAGWRGGGLASLNSEDELVVYRGAGARQTAS